MEEQLKVRIIADTENFKKGINEVSGNLTKLKSSVKGALAAAAAVTATIAVIKKVADKVADLGDEIDKNSQKVRMSYKDYQEWSYIMKLCGGNASTLVSATNMLTNRIKEGSGAFQSLGVSIKDANGETRSTNDIFDDTIKALQGIKNDTDRAAAASEIFGRQAQQLAPLLNMSTEEMEGARRTARALGTEMSDAAVKASARFKDMKETLSMAGQGILNTLGETLLPILTTITQKLALAVGYINAFLQAIFKIGGTGNISKPVEKMAASAQKANEKVKQLKAQLMGFDELNKIDKSGAVDAEGGILGSGTAETGSFSLLDDSDLTKLEKFKNALKDISIPKIDFIPPDLISTFTTIKDTVSLIWGDMWEALKTSFSNFKEEYAPDLEEFKTNIVDTFSSTGMLINKVWKDAFSNIQSWWEERGKKTFEGVLGVINDIGAVALKIWNNFIFPIINKVAEQAGRLWDNAIKPLWDNILKFVSSVGDFLTALWDTILKPVVNWIINYIVPPIKQTINIIISIIETVAETVINVVSGIIRSVSGVLDFITGVFTLDLDKALQGVKDMIGGVMDSIWALIKGAVNVIIDGMNLVINNLYGAIRGVVNGVGSIVESFGELLGFDDWGWSIPEQAPQIPKLASGAFDIPKGQLFIANEAGAEMVGSMDGKTAVANNQQIVEGVAGGVAEAMAIFIPSIIEAIRENKTDVVIGDDIIYQAAQRGVNKNNRLVGAY